MRATVFVTGAVGALLAGTPAAPLTAQEWRVSAQGGRMRTALDPAASDRVALGLRYEAPTTGFGLTGGVPLRPEEPWTGAASAWTRLAVRRRGLLAGIDLAGSAFLSLDRPAGRDGGTTGPLPGPFDPPLPASADRSGHALAAQAMPVVGWEGARLQLHARTGLSRHAARFGDARMDRSVRLAELQLTAVPSASLAIVPVVRRFQAAGEAASLFTGVSALTASPRGTLWASIGRWVGGEGGGTPWSAGGRLPLHARVALEGAMRRDTFDPLYRQPAQTSWSVGLSLQVGGAAPSAAPPVPAAYVDGRATLRLPVAASGAQPSIAGDFNDWTPAPMTRAGDHWTYTVALARGVYHYAFVDPAGGWFVPEGVPGRRDDGMGGHVAVLVVP